MPDRPDSEPISPEEIKSQELMLLAAELGFESTNELEDIERQIRESVEDEGKLYKLLAEWLDKANRDYSEEGKGKMVDRQIMSDTANLLVRANILRSIGREDDAREEIESIMEPLESIMPELAERLKKFL
jgi:hypothetical protein